MGPAFSDATTNPVRLSNFLGHRVSGQLFSTGQRRKCGSKIDGEQTGLGLKYLKRVVPIGTDFIGYDIEQQIGQPGNEIPPERLMQHEFMGKQCPYGQDEKNREKNAEGKIMISEMKILNFLIKTN